MGTFGREFIDPVLYGRRRKQLTDLPGVAGGLDLKAAALGAAAFFYGLRLNL
jgi:hypothetical protein